MLLLLNGCRQKKWLSKNNELKKGRQRSACRHSHSATTDIQVLVAEIFCAMP